MSRPEVIKFTHLSATCNVTIWNDGTDSASVSDVFSTEKRQGHATKLLEEVIAYADKEQLILKTAAEPYGEEPHIPIENLTEFYLSFGFIVLGDDPEFVYMERIPI